MNKLIVILIATTVALCHSVAYSEEQDMNPITVEEILSDRYIEVIVGYEFNVDMEEAK